KDQCHIGGYIIVLEKLAHLRQPWILEILRATDNRISIRMRAEIAGHQRVHHLATDEITVHVLLLINRFQFALEKTEYRVNQALAVDLRPLNHILRRKRIEIDRGIV